MMHVGVVAAGNGVVEARVLATALARHHPDWPVTVLVAPGLHPDGGGPDEPYALLSPTALGFAHLDRLVASAPVAQVVATLRPLLALHLLADGAERVLLLAADAEPHGALDALEAAVRDHDAVLVPRLTGRLPDDERRPDGRDLLAAGELDDGVVAVRAGATAEAFLRWWSERALEAAEPRAAGAGDPRAARNPLAAAPLMYPGLTLLDDAGYNVSHWNLHERPLAATDAGLTAAGRPLRLLRWEGFRPDRPWWLSEHASRVLILDDPLLTELSARRARALRDAGWLRLDALTSGDGRLPNGIRMDERVTRLHAEALADGEEFGSVLAPAGADAFRAWLTSVPIGAGIQRYARDVWRERSDLREAFPDLADADAEPFVSWLWEHGVAELELQEALLPEPPVTVTPADARVPPVLVTGYMRGNLGLGQAARAYLSALQAADVPVGTRTLALELPLHRHSDDSQGAIERTFGDLRLPTGVQPELDLLCMNADQLQAFAERAGREELSARYTIGHWAWETDVIPASWQRSFELVDELWVISSYVAENLARAGDVPVITVPLPVVAPDPTAAAVPYELSDAFVFLFAFDHFSTLERKNPVGTISAFKRAFAPGEGPLLLIKTINAALRPEAHQHLRHAIGDRPDIRLVDGILTPAEMDALFGRADCYVSLHRSEGFGLTLAESMALGKPVIATGYSGNTDFMTPANSYLVDWTLTRVGADGEHYPAEGFWAEPSLDHAAAQLRAVFDDRAEAARRGARAAADVAAGLSPEAVGRIARDRLIRIGARRRAAAPPAGAPGPDPELSRLVDVPLGVGDGGKGPRAALRRAALRDLHEYAGEQRRLDRALVSSVERISLRLESERAARQRDRAIVTHAAADSAGTREELTARLGELTAKLEELEGELLAERADRRSLEDRLALLERRMPEPRAAELDGLVRAARAIPYTAGDPFAPFDHPLAGRVLGFRARRAPAVERSESYSSFEDVFRGPRERVGELLTPYVELLRGHAPVLDVGCGRGELLELLGGAGIEARGVDSDAGMAARARERGVDVAVADALEHLEGLADASLGAIVSIQVVEHLRPEALRELVRVAGAKLRPGGLLVAETVNPHAGHALKTFWVDLTHRHPLFPEVLLALARDAGYREAFIWHPLGRGDVERDRFDESSYALVATA